MLANTKVQGRPDVSAAERTSHELVMRVLKLRWMGMENETESDGVVLRRVDPQRTLPAGFSDAD